MVIHTFRAKRFLLAVVESGSWRGPRQRKWSFKEERVLDESATEVSCATEKDSRRHLSIEQVISLGHIRLFDISLRTCCYLTNPTALYAPLVTLRVALKLRHLVQVLLPE